MSVPHQQFWASTPPRVTRRGSFWVSGERVSVDGKTCQRAPMFVEWEAPDQVTRPHPVVLVHGGGSQGTEWLETPYGRPGWAQRLVEAGYAVLVVDRPGHGRSPFHPEVVGAMGPPFTYEGGRGDRIVEFRPFYWNVPVYRAAGSGPIDLIRSSVCD